MFEEGDFRAAGLEVSASHHSKNLLRLDCAVSDLSISVSFFLVGENTLASDLSLQNGSESARDVHVFAVQRLEHELGPNIRENLAGEGKSFLILNLHFRGRRFDLRYKQTAEGEFRASLTMAEKARGIRVADQAGRDVPVQWAARAATFTVKNHALYRVRQL